MAKEFGILIFKVYTKISEIAIIELIVWIEPKILNVKLLFTHQIQNIHLNCIFEIPKSREGCRHLWVNIVDNLHFENSKQLYSLFSNFYFFSCKIIIFKRII